VTINGKQRDVVDHINKNAYNYVLDPATGKPVVGVVETPVPQDPRAHTYPTQPIPIGDELVPHVIQDPQDYQGVIAPDGKPFLVATQPFTPYTDQQYVVMSPTATGGVEWPNPAFDPNTGYEVVCATIQSYGLEAPPAADQHPVISSSSGIIQWRTSTTPNSLSVARLVAFNPATNKIVWKHDEVSTGGIARGNSSSCSSPVTITASGLALIGRTVATPNAPLGSGMIQAYDVHTGNLLWQKEVLVHGFAAPVVPRLVPYMVNGKEYIATFVHSGSLGADLSAFALP
jgi:glucose dehydrogenase